MLKVLFVLVTGALAYGTIAPFISAMVQTLAHVNAALSL